ncbi:TraB/GumN family protein [Marinicella rhabdoformis]|uniref:TraB/GumN family protein n=1 Tax=Marinicella rhabdoformis TaxID=2580566 RepID=UPI001C551492|nr:TraB/GumN family protein [Marinicella rhabdoformis]
MVSSATAQNNIPELNKIVVSGKVPGPDLWKVTHGDNTLWILGTLSPLPKRIDWNSIPVEQVIKKSQAFMNMPSFYFDLDEVGFFGKISLATSAIGIKKNPEKQKLKDILPAEVYARWLSLKHQYIGKSRSIEKTRPIFAVYKLLEKALKENGLTSRTKVVKKLRKVAKKHRLEVIEPKIKVDFKEPKSMVKKFKKTAINDLECFIKTLDRVEHDLDNMSVRANAWSLGEVDVIKSLPYVDEGQACSSTFLNSDLAQEVGLFDIRSRLRKVWIEAIDDALSSNRSTFAVWPITQLLSDESILNDLAAKGYLIKSPH